MVDAVNALQVLMQADSRFKEKSPQFWSYIRLISERMGYYQLSEEEDDPDEVVAVIDSNANVELEVSSNKFSDVITIVSAGT